MYVKTNQIQTVSNIHQYNTRVNRYAEPHNLKFFGKKASFIGTKFLFCLPKHIAEESNINVLKKKM